MSVDNLLQNVVSLTTLASMGATFTAVVVLSYLRSSVGIVLCLFALMGKVLMGEGSITYVMGIALNFNDIVYLTLAVVAVLRWMHLIGRWRIPVEHVVLLLLAVLLLVNFVRGVGEFGPQDADNELRCHFYFVSGAAYFASFEPIAKRTDWLLRVWVAASLVICVVALQRFVVAGGINFALLRVVDSGVTLMLAQALIISLYLWVSSRNPRLYRNLAFVLLPFVVIMQHRTVWVVLMATIVLILLWEARLRNRLIGVLAVGAVLTSVGVLAIYGDRGSEVLEESATETGTFEWRVDGWKALLQEQMQNSGDMLVGRPMGAGFERFMRGAFVDYSPHNYYIELLIVGGGIGVLLLMFIYVRVSIRSLSQPARPERSMPVRLGIVLLVSQLVFFITYAPQPEQSVLFGLVLSLSLAPSRLPSSEVAQSLASKLTIRRLHAGTAEEPGV